MTLAGYGTYGVTGDHPPDSVTSVFGRTGAVVAVAGDYDSDEVTNVSGVAGASVSDALDNLEAALPAVAIVSTQEEAFVGSTTTTGSYATLLSLAQTMEAGEVLLIDAFAAGIGGSSLSSSALFVQVQINGTTVCSCAEHSDSLQELACSVTARVAVGSLGLVAGANTITLRVRDNAGSVDIDSAEDGQGARLRLQRLTG